MQVSPWTNGQLLQEGQLQSTHPSARLSHNTRGNNGFGNNASHFVHQNTGAGALVGHYKLYNGVKIPAQSVGGQRPNYNLPVNYISFPPNSAQSLPKQNHETFCPIVQLASCGTLSSTVPDKVMHNYPQGSVKYGLNENAQIENPISSSSPQQRPVHLNQTKSQTCSQKSQNTLPTYTEALLKSCRTKYLTSNDKNVFVATPSSVATSCVNLAATNNQREPNNYLLSRLNEIHASQTVKKHTPLLTRMLKTKNTSHSLLAACLQTHSNSHQNQEQPTARGRGEMHTVCHFLPTSSTLTANENNNLITSRPSVMLTAQTSLPECTNATSGFQNIRTPQKNAPINKQGMSLIYQKINSSINKNKYASISPSSHIGHVSQVPQVNRCDMNSVFQVNGGSVHTSPRAVAVVPPLAQKGPSELASPNSQPSLKPVPSPSQLETNRNIRSDTTWPIKLSHIPVENAGNVQATSPFPNQTQADLYDKTKHAAMSQSCSQVTEGSIQSATLSKRRRSLSANRKTPTEQNPFEKELSSLPTTEWSLDKLFVMIQGMEKDNTNNNYEAVPVTQVMDRYWGKSGKAEINVWYKQLITEVNKFCSDIDLNEVILRQMKSFNNLSTKYCVLQHDEVYQEDGSYTSTWLNNNSQLNDIEKEFGFPWFWKYSECDSSSDSTSAETHSKLEDESHSEQVKAMCQNDSDQCASNQSDVHSEDDFSYLFKIEVLPSDEAKAIFEQTQCKSPQMEDTSLPEENGSSGNTDKTVTCHASTIDVVCCIEKWKEKVFGLTPEGKCKCQDLKKKLDDESCQSMENLIVDSPKNDSTPVLALKEEENIQESPNNKTNIIVVRESEHNSEAHMSNSTDHEDDLGDLLEPADSHPVANTNKNPLEAKTGYDCNVNTSEILLLLEECRMELVKTPEEKDASNSNASSALFSPSDEPQEGDTKLPVYSHDLLSQLNPKTLKRQSHLKSQTIFESFSKRKNNASVKRVELLLFGSEKRSVSTRRSHFKSPDNFPEKMHQPPRRVTVKLGPSKRIAEADSFGDILVKRRIHENWRKSFPPTPIRLRRKNNRFFVISPAKTNSRRKKNIIVNSKRKINDAGNNQGHKRKRGNVHVLKKPINDEMQPPQENVLKFNVLPNTFSFKEEGSISSDGMIDTAPDEKMVTVTEAKDSQPVKKTIGTWCEDYSKKYRLRSQTITETKTVFEEYQKRYKMMTRTTMD